MRACAAVCWRTLHPGHYEVQLRHVCLGMQAGAGGQSVEEGAWAGGHGGAEPEGSEGGTGGLAPSACLLTLKLVKDILDQG